jgi:hypothetical protein
MPISDSLASFETPKPSQEFRNPKLILYPSAFCLQEARGVIRKIYNPYVDLSYWTTGTPVLYYSFRKDLRTAGQRTFLSREHDPRTRLSSHDDHGLFAATITFFVPYPLPLSFEATLPWTALPTRLSIGHRAPPPPFRALLTSSFGSWGFLGEKFQLALFRPCRPAEPGLSHIFPSVQ